MDNAPNAPAGGPVPVQHGQGQNGGNTSLGRILGSPHLLRFVAPQQRDLFRAMEADLLSDEIRDQVDSIDSSFWTGQAGPIVSTQTDLTLHIKQAVRNLARHAARVNSQQSVLAALLQYLQGMRAALDAPEDNPDRVVMSDTARGQLAMHIASLQQAIDRMDVRTNVPTIRFPSV